MLHIFTNYDPPPSHYWEGYDIPTEKHPMKVYHDESEITLSAAYTTHYLSIQ